VEPTTALAGIPNCADARTAVLGTAERNA